MLLPYTYNYRLLQRAEFKLYDALINGGTHHLSPAANSTNNLLMPTKIGGRTTCSPLIHLNEHRELNGWKSNDLLPQDLQQDPAQNRDLKIH